MSAANSVAMLAFTILGIGCANTLVVRRPLTEAALAKVNESIEGHRAKVVLAQKPGLIEAMEVSVGRDTTSWLELRSGTGDAWQKSFAPTAALRVLAGAVLQ